MTFPRGYSPYEGLASNSAPLSQQGCGRFSGPTEGSSTRSLKQKLNLKSSTFCSTNPYAHTQRQGMVGTGLRLGDGSHPTTQPTACQCQVGC